MKSGKWQKKQSDRRNFLLKIYFFGGSVILILVFLIYTNALSINIRKEVKIVPDLYSKFIGLPADVNLESFLFQYFMTEIFPEIDYPIILADSLKTPFSWENIDIEKKSFSQLEEKQQQQIYKLVRKFESRGAVIPLKLNMESDEVISYVYYGESKALIMLKAMPYIEFVIVIIFFAFGIYGLMRIKKTEKNLIWVGLAKETAHQFGTPLSSLIGWKDVLEMKFEGKKKNAEVLDILENMSSDIARLNKIASRFGKVGSIIERKPSNLHEIIQETIEYFRLRLPSQSQMIDLQYISRIEGLKIKIDPDLIKWTLENLIKNCIDALKNKEGFIKIEAFPNKNNIHIQITDNGKGIPKSMFKRIFEPGITTKERGWGLGLSLAKRIIEEYHKGIIRVQDSQMNIRTVIEIILPEE